MKTKTKLSERIRPNCEAAPWVIEEIKVLEKHFLCLKEKYHIAFNALLKIHLKDDKEAKKALQACIDIDEPQ